MGVCERSEPQDVLPFPPTPSGSTAGRTMQESVYSPRAAAARLPDDAPEHPDRPDRRRRARRCRRTFGGEINTPTLDRIAKGGISYNRFHTTAMCSPTRAALLTGRNHHRVGNGQITELANDWDGYPGTSRRRSATVAEVLKNYGYNTAALGKWHNTPAERDHRGGAVRVLADRLRLRVFLRLPRRRGVAVRAAPGAQHDRRASRRTTPEEGYHLTEDLADDAIDWLRKHKAFSARQAVLHVLGDAAPPRPAPRHEGVGRQVQRQVRRRLGQVSRARRSRGRRSWAGFRRTRNSRRARRRWRPGTTSRRTRSRSSAA